jgi:hypothetical protein
MEGDEHNNNTNHSSPDPNPDQDLQLCPVLSGTRSRRPVEVFVREKLRVESADPSLLSLSAKLTALGHTLAVARRNLAAVMGEEVEED